MPFDSSECFTAVIDPHLLCACRSPVQTGIKRPNLSYFEVGELYYAQHFHSFLWKSRGRDGLS